MTTATLPPPATAAHPKPRASTLPRATLEKLAVTEYARFLELLRSLDPADWRLPTDCPAWDVRALAGHVLGMTEMPGTVSENIRQTLAARRRGGVFIAALTALQVEEHQHLTTEELIARFAKAGPRGARGRARTPGFVRGLRMPGEQPVGDATEPWTVGYLVETILTRDTWMHRIDLSRATRRKLVLTADHDGVIVADVATEWAARHGRPCALRLDGPVGGAWTFGDGRPEQIELDAVEFCRIVSGRGRGAGLLAVQVPF